MSGATPWPRTGLADEYAGATMARLRTMLDTQRVPMRAAGVAVATALAADGRVWITQTSHSLHLEGTGRAGGLVAVHALEDRLAIGPHDVLIAGTTAGVFESIVEDAIVARKRGAVVVALIQLEHEQDPALSSSHSTGQRLHEVADIVVDLGGRLGDGEINLADTDIAILPSSGVTGILALWMICAEAVEALATRGRLPLVLQSNLQEGAQQGNAERLSRYRASGQGSVKSTEW